MAIRYASTKGFISNALDVEVFYVEGMSLDKLPTRLDFFSHQYAKQIISGRRIGHRHTQQRAIGGIQRCVSQFLGIHFSEPLEPGDRETLFPCPPHGRQQTSQILEADGVITATQRVAGLFGTRAIFWQKGFDTEPCQRQFC